MDLVNAFDAAKGIWETTTGAQGLWNAPTIAEKVPHGLGMAGGILTTGAKLFGAEMAKKAPLTLAGLGSTPAAGLAAGLGASSARATSDTVRAPSRTSISTSRTTLAGRRKAISMTTSS